MTASDIMALLMVRHAKDIAVEECPLEAWGKLRADLWVLRPSWSKPQVTIYEVKVTRQDFLRDDKHRSYLDACNCLYFAAPRGVIKPEELSEECGLLEVAASGGMLRTVKKAPYRVPTGDGMATVMKAVLMNRAIIGPSRYGARDAPLSRERRIAQWEMNTTGGRQVDYLVKGAISKRLEDLKAENRELRNAADELKSFRSALVEAGWDPGAMTVWGFRAKLDAARGRTALGSLLKVRATLDAEIDREKAREGGE